MVDDNDGMVVDSVIARFDAAHGMDVLAVFASVVDHGMPDHYEQAAVRRARMIGAPVMRRPRVRGGGQVLRPAEIWVFSSALKQAAAVYAAFGQPDRAAVCVGGAVGLAEALGKTPPTLAWDDEAMLDRLLADEQHAEEFARGRKASPRHLLGELDWLVERLTDPFVLRPAVDRAFPWLSDRAKDVLALFANGLPRRRVAEELGIAIRSLEPYLTEIRDASEQDTLGAVVAVYMAAAGMTAE